MSLLSNLLRKQPTHQPQIQQSGQQMVPIGQLLSNRYQVSEILGRGAMGEVYLAEDTVLGGVSVAIKVISQAMPSKQLQEKFSREAQIGAFLGHHNVNIVRVLDFGVHNDEVPFYVMEYVYGSTLADEIDQQPLPLDRCVRLISQVCAGLQSAHQGVLIDKKLYSVLHRDLKPGNIFITSNSSFGEMAKILDFGIAEFFLPTHKSTEADAMGTLAYASSEQLLGKKLEPSADIYSLGVTMFEALTGKMPIQPARNTVAEWIEAHSKQPPRRLKEVAPHLNIPESVEALIQKCLEKKPRKRPQTIQEVLDQLQQISQGIGANFPIKTQSHDEALEALFNSNTAPNQAARQAFQASQAPEMTQQISHTVSPNATVVDIQPSKQPLAQTQQIVEKPTNIIQRLSWPDDKPQAEIVFAQSQRVAEVERAALWAMLHQATAQQQAFPYYRIEFAAVFDPHPMLAWVTILHDRQGKMRCLPCFLDLVHPHRQNLLQKLVQQSNFLFLLFDINDPSKPAKTANIKIDARQQRFLHQTVLKARGGRGAPTASPAAIATSKRKLKMQYEALKARLSQQLAQGR